MGKLSRKQLFRGWVFPCVSLLGMCRPKGYGLLNRFGLKTDINLDHYGLNVQRNESELVLTSVTANISLHLG